MLDPSTTIHIYMWVFTQNMQRAFPMCTDSHFIHLPLRSAFRAKLQDKNLFIYKVHQALFWVLFKII